MKNYTNNHENNPKQTTIKEQTKDIFLKLIKEREAAEQEMLLKLYNEIIKKKKK